MTAEHPAVCAGLQTPSPNEETLEGRDKLVRRLTVELPATDRRRIGSEVYFEEITANCFYGTRDN